MADARTMLLTFSRRPRGYTYQAGQTCMVPVDQARRFLRRGYAVAAHSETSVAATAVCVPADTRQAPVETATDQRASEQTVSRRRRRKQTAGEVSDG